MIGMGERKAGREIQVEKLDSVEQLPDWLDSLSESEREFALRLIRNRLALWLHETQAGEEDCPELPRVDTQARSR